ncbi:OLC1v1029332C1 [Oldenlandia corymbosa var. corymbosa]|uniref:OLC1v1029332C1 n=1 Tax=Oldenlandia corymbosa var. corymbosa TaxID=529605 RepID=A0AAV1CH17_OLDCO|nr:OLC1v1029332C1 [Oldenlandia corymbosa var. corymbosa]
MAKSQLSKHLSPTVNETSSLWLFPTITLILQKTLNSQPNTKPQDLSGILNQFSHHLIPRLVTQFINHLANPFHALHFFNWSSNLNPNPNNYFHTHFCHIAITDKLLSNKLFTLAQNLLESHNRFSHFMVEKFIKSSGDLGHFKWAFKLFHHMIKEGIVKPGVSTYTTMTKGFWQGYCAAGRSDEAIEHFKEMVKLGLELDQKSHMPLMGVSPNFLSYNAVIIGLARAHGRTCDVEMLVNDMLQNGQRMDATLYSHIILGYCEDGSLDKALKVFLEMIDENYTMNLEFFEVISKRLIAIGKSFEIENLFDTIKQKCGVTNIYDYQKKHSRSRIDAGQQEDFSPLIVRKDEKPSVPLKQTESTKAHGVPSQNHLAMK